MGRPDTAVLVRRAISVQLTTVARGQLRLLQSTWTGRSDAHTGVAALLPKLTVRVRIRVRRARRRARPGATLGATRTNDILILRTSTDNRQERARGHGLI